MPSGNHKRGPSPGRKQERRKVKEKEKCQQEDEVRSVRAAAAAGNSQQARERRSTKAPVNLRNRKGQHYPAPPDKKKKVSRQKKVVAKSQLRKQVCNKARASRSAPPVRKMRRSFSERPFCLCKKAKRVNSRRVRRERYEKVPARIAVWKHLKSVIDDWIEGE